VTEGGSIRYSMRSLRSWLYVPGNREDLFAIAVQSGADAVIVDLEDMVQPSEKARARDIAAELIASRVGADGPVVFARLNAVGTGLAELDLEAIVHTDLGGLRIPKVESSRDVEQIARLLDALEPAGMLGRSSLPLIPILESARGIANATAIASSPRVALLGFGATDYLSDIGAADDPLRLASIYARSIVVSASRLAGIGAPCDGVYTSVNDEDGLRATCRMAKAMGFSGRTAIDARQVSVINEEFTPTENEVQRARQLLKLGDEQTAAGVGSFVTPDGQFVDVAVLRRAKAVLELAGALGVVRS
jgi:citrate lyase subunit beta / citryl-CoA lyase